MAAGSSHGCIRKIASQMQTSLENYVGLTRGGVVAASAELTIGPPALVSRNATCATRNVAYHTYKKHQRARRNPKH